MDINEKIQQKRRERQEFYGMLGFPIGAIVGVILRCVFHI
jgi:hypothetical protein